MKATQDRVLADPYYDELNRLFGLYRLANLNARYYGIRAAKFEWWSKGALVLIAVLTTSALVLILAAPPEQPVARYCAATLAGIATLVSGVTPFLGWSEKIQELRNQHYAYSQVFGQVEFAIAEIRRVGELLPEHIGLARMVHEGYMRIEALDELEPDRKLIDREDAKVRKAFPDDYLWTNF